MPLKGESTTLDSRIKQSDSQRTRWAKIDNSRIDTFAKRLKESGVIPLRETKMGRYNVRRLLSIGQDKFILLHLKWAGGGHSKGATKKGSRFIKPEYLGKYFVGLKEDRTSLVRFFMNVFHDNLKCETSNEARPISHWLKSFSLSHAEIVAILTSLGYRYSARYPPHMKIDGYLDHKPQAKL